jgi:sugar phosphate isomerase/epimerase
MNSGASGVTAPAVAAHHWSFYDLEVADACDHARGLGYRGIDLAVGDLGSGPRLELEKLASARGECERIGELGKSKGLAFTDFVAAVVHLPGMTHGVRAAGLEAFQRFAEHGASMGITGVTVLPGFYDTEWAEAFDLVAGELRRYVDAGGAGGLRVSIEPHLESVTDSPARTLQMLETVPGLTLTLDYSHFIHAGYAQSDIEPLDEHARHLHVRQAAPGRLAAPVGDGTIDHRRLLTHLHALGYAGAFTTEYVRSPWYDQDKVDTERENALIKGEIEALVDDVWA